MFVIDTTAVLSCLECVSISFACFDARPRGQGRHCSEERRKRKQNSPPPLAVPAGVGSGGEREAVVVRVVEV